MNCEAFKEFETRCLEAKEACEQMGSATEFEPYLLSVLTHVKAHPSLKVNFRAAFIQMLSDPSKGPWELITFCMHELRWPEVEAAAHARLMSASDWRIKNVMADVIDAFSDKWGEAELYSYYSGRDDHFID
jgi:hypothetical protein